VKAPVAGLVADNIAYGLKVRQVSKKEIDRRWVLAQVKLMGLRSQIFAKRAGG
jgi:ABC-type sulfate/molybdate transport systems ATPase subunit